MTACLTAQDHILKMETPCCVHQLSSYRQRILLDIKYYMPATAMRGVWLMYRSDKKFGYGMRLCTGAMSLSMGVNL